MAKRRRAPRVPGTFDQPPEHLKGIRRPKCEPCLVQAGELRRAIAAGQLPLEELRAAFDFLEHSKTPPGETIETKAESNGAIVYYCPRHTPPDKLKMTSRGKVIALRV
jgi:hypothetical protein